LDRPAPHQLAAFGGSRRADALAIAVAGVAAVSPRVLMPRVADAVRVAGASRDARLHVIAVGKAAAGMYAAFAAAPPWPIARGLVIAPQRPDDWRLPVPFVEGGHPFATAGSEHGARLALTVAAEVPADGCLVCLLSGGASALMAAPIDGLTLAVKQQAVAHVMTGGADITALNAVRKHLSRVKGGRLAAACPGSVVTYAISDVIGDDLSVIGSGPCVPDSSTWADAVAAVERYGGWAGLPAEVRAILEAGRRGALPDTPKAADPRLARATAEVIGGRRQAMAGAAAAAEARGYRPVGVEAPVTGEARAAAAAWWESAHAASAGNGGPVAIISSGETTVRVRGRGRGGRNQEFAAALVQALAESGGAAVVASIGTDGIDGPTDAAGGIVDAGSAGRAATAGLDAARALDDNDCYPFLDATGDLVRLGPTGTNVGDLQVLLTGPA
jgi:hydroxypyruvate reductase